MAKNYPKFKFSFFALFAGLAICGSVTAQTVTTFNYSGSMATFTVPTCVFQVTFDISGAQGNSSSYGVGGLGGRIQGVYTVTPGQVLNIFVGGVTYNGGGTGYGSTPYGMPGGGASDIRIGGTALSNRVLVAGGGGGAGYNCSGSTAQNGGLGGGYTGATGYYCSSQGGGYSGTGGTQSGGGTSQGGLGTAGTAGQGGNGYSLYGGGGGGGYYGGGGGSYGGGGGGSSYAGTGTLSLVHTQGYKSGNGQVILTYGLGGPAVVAVADPTAICTGNSATLTASGVTTYTWMPGGAQTESIVVSPTTNTTYTVVGTNTAGCTTSVVLTVTVDPGTPTLSIVNTASATGGVCPNQFVTLTASGARTYTWSGPHTVNNGVAFQPTIPGTYTVNGTNACGTTSAVTSVSIHPTPTIIANVSQPTICSGNTLTFTIAGHTGTNTSQPPYWQAQNGIHPSNGSAYIAQVTQNYTAIGFNVQTCSATSVINVTVVPTPLNLPTATPTRICIGSTGTLQITGATNYSWDAVGTFTGSTAPTITVNPTSTTIYTVTKSNSNCVDVRTITLYVNNLPTIFAGPSQNTVCAGTSVTMSAFGATHYTWTSVPAPPSPYPSGTVANNIYIAPQLPINFTLSAFDGTCGNVITTSVHVNPNPTITVAAAKTAICLNQCTTFSIGGADTYTWSTNPAGPPPSGTFATLCPTITTNYKVTGTNQYSCEAYKEQVLIVHNLPGIGVGSSPTLVCSGFPSTLTATPFPPQGHIGPITYAYAWDTGSNQNKATVNPINSSCYVVTVTVNQTTCKDTRTVCVNVFHPVFSITSNTSICKGGSIALCASGALTYTWTNPPSNFQCVTVSPPMQTVYQVAATSSSNNVFCISTQQMTLSIYEQPTVTATAESTVACRGDFVNLIAQGANTYVWSNFMQGGTVAVAPLTQTHYSVIGTDIYGCKDTAYMKVEVSSCVGLNVRVSHAGVKVYPNPSSNLFVVSADLPVSLVLYNELGQTIRMIEVNAHNGMKAEVSDLPSGVYLLSGGSGEATVRQKIIISK
jgi:hypothetical protein